MIISCHEGLILFLFSLKYNWSKYITHNKIYYIKKSFHFLIYLFEKVHHFQDIRLSPARRETVCTLLQ